MRPEKEGIVKRLRQGAVVVTSILIAFGVDALWEESKERRDLHNDLVNIMSELDENRARVVYHLDLAHRMSTALDLLYLAIEPGGPTLLVADTTAWLAHINPTLDASLGAIDALLASGRMAVVQNPELSRRLAGLRDRVEDAVEEQVQASDVYMDRVVPELDDFDHQATRHISDAFWSQERTPGRALEYRGQVAYPVSASLATASNLRQTLYYVSIGELRGLGDEFDLIEELIEAEVGGR